MVIEGIGKGSPIVTVGADMSTSDGLVGRGEGGSMRLIDVVGQVNFIGSAG